MSIQLQALLLELLVSGFFAIACFKARAAREPGALAMSPRDFLKLTDRIDRLSRTRYQWVAMAAILILVRMQVGVPITVELTAVAEFIVFVALPVGKTEKALPAAKQEKRPTRAERSVKSLHRQKCVALASARH
ncbi:MAG: hypothetical protein ACRD25_06940 [Terracidiphilus sp.]